MIQRGKLENYIMYWLARLLKIESNFAELERRMGNTVKPNKTPSETADLEKRQRRAALLFQKKGL